MDDNQNLRPSLRRYKNGDPCSRCGKTENAGGCGDCLCDDCIDPHFDEDDPDFCPAQSWIPTALIL
jgi:hypothetical protein